jgi:protein-S-isoprenylcysteine O-methyltransferase Ste14
MTGGILGYIRHPMYFGILLIYLAFLAFLFLSTSLLCMGFFIIVLITYNKMANYEEKVLEKLFGEEYLEYKQNVSKWFPNPF